MTSSCDTSWVQKGRVPCLDGFRGIAVLLVIFTHLGSNGRLQLPLLYRLYHSLYWADLGVTLFFVLSGFLITLLLLRESETSGSISLPSFYRRRILRIIPAYAAYLTIMSLLQVAGAISIGQRDWLGALTYTTNFLSERGWELGHFWSLAVEEHFYLVWPSILALFGLFFGRWMLVLCIAGSPLIRYVSSLYWSQQETVNNFTFNCMDTIAFGAGLAYLCQSKRFLKFTVRLEPVYQTVFVCACAGVLGSFWLAKRSDLYEILAHRSVSGLSCAAMIYLAASFSGKTLFRPLSWSPLVWVGVLSYSLYIWQQPFTGRSQLPEFFSAWPQNLIFIAAAGTCSYFLIERPFLQLKQGVRLRRPSRAPSVLVEPRPACMESQGVKV